MRAFRKLLVADFKQFFRDRTALFFTFAFPLLFMLIFGVVFSGEEDMSFDIGLAKGDDSRMAEMIAGALHEVPVLEVNEGELGDMLAEMEKGDLQAVVVIPANIESTIASGNPASITLYYDPSRTTSVQVLLPVLRQVIQGMNQRLVQQPVLLEVQEESVHSHNLRSIDYLVPGILAMSVLFLGLFGGLPLVEWREKKILRRFGATPLRRSTVVQSQVTYRLVLSLLQAAIIIGVARLVFDVQVIGSWLMLLGLLLLGTCTFISIGYLAISRASTVEGAMPIIQIIQFPMMFLSGIFFPIDIMPDFIRPVVEAIPLTYLGDGFRQIMVQATPLHPLSVDVAVLAGWLVACMLLAIRLFRWE